jgi:hypothetical protein
VQCEEFLHSIHPDISLQLEHYNLLDEIVSPYLQELHLTTEFGKLLSSQKHISQFYMKLLQEEQMLLLVLFNS